MPRRRRLWTLILLAGISGTQAAIHSPRVLSPHNADTYSLKTFVGDLDDTADDREASIVKLAAAGASLSLSLDNGLSWQELPTDAERTTLDLTPQVSGRYGYLFRIELRGDPEKAVVRSLEITTWVQVHPASLPSLRQGRNMMRLVTGDHYGLATQVMAIRLDAADRDDFLKHLVEAPKDYNPARRTSRIRGAFVAKVTAPPGPQLPGSLLAQALPPTWGPRPAHATQSTTQSVSRRISTKSIGPLFRLIKATGTTMWIARLS